MSKAKQISERMESIRVTKNITRSMKVVASTRFSQIKKKLDNVICYHEKIEELLGRTWEGKEEILSNHRYFEKNDEKGRVLLLLLAGERGLCGAFNQYIFSQFEKSYARLRRKKRQVVLLPIGKVATDYLRKKKYEIQSTEFSEYNALKDSAKLFSYSSSSFLEKAFDQVLLLHQSAATEVSKVGVRLSTIFPVAPLSLLANSRKGMSRPTVIYETAREELIAQLLPKFIRSLFTKKLLIAKLGEERTRMIAMGKATDNADELFKELKIRYNRTRQQHITRQIIEIVAGAEALQ